MRVRAIWTAIPLLLICALFAALSKVDAATAQSPAPIAKVSLSSFAITPRVLHLKAGEAVLLQVSNDSSIAHDFSAPAFFEASRMPQGAAATVESGRISLGPHQALSIQLAPSAGQYPTKCTHPFHKMLGMSGLISVE